MEYHEVQWHEDFDVKHSEDLQVSDPIQADLYLNKYINSSRKAYVPKEMVDWIANQLPDTGDLKEEAIPITFELLTGVERNHIILYNLQPIENFQDDLTIHPI
jgi:hypothetical protein